MPDRSRPAGVLPADQVMPVTGAKATRGASSTRLLRAVGAIVFVALLGFALVWAFLAYTRPGMVVDLASLLQMCGISVAR